MSIKDANWNLKLRPVFLWIIGIYQFFTTLAIPFYFMYDIYENALETFTPSPADASIFQSTNLHTILIFLGINGGGMLLIIALLIFIYKRSTLKITSDVIEYCWGINRKRQIPLKQIHTIRYRKWLGYWQVRYMDGKKKRSLNLPLYFFAGRETRREMIDFLTHTVDEVDKTVKNI